MKELNPKLVLEKGWGIKIRRNNNGKLRLQLETTGISKGNFITVLAVRLLPSGDKKKA